MHPFTFCSFFFIYQFGLLISIVFAIVTNNIVLYIIFKSRLLLCYLLYIRAVCIRIVCVLVYIYICVCVVFIVQRDGESQTTDYKGWVEKCVCGGGGGGILTVGGSKGLPQGGRGVIDHRSR